MDKLKMHSPNLTAQNIDKIAELFPTVMTERVNEDGNPVRAIDFDLLRQELSDHVVEGPQERYQLDWPGKREALFATNAPIAKTLRPMRDESVDFDTTKNLFIEGDNLDALKLLQESYLGKVKLIYIDPPYNTGNYFVYNDSFATSAQEYLTATGEMDDLGNRLSVNIETSGRYHSSWLSMMLPRLRTARNLLADDGVLAVSIDDREVANLRALLDETFGRAGFIASVIWQKRYSRENRGSIGDAHEYVLLYAKSPSLFQKSRGLIPPTKAQLEVYKNPNNDSRGRWRPIPMTAQGFRPNQMYPITGPSGKEHLPPDGRCWSMVESEFRKLEEKGRVYFGKDGDAQPSVIRYLDEVKGFVPWTWWPAEEVGHTDQARKEIRSIFGSQTVFDTPKPVSLLKRLVQIAMPEGGLALDFFAGSGTLGQAIFEVNGADGGNRSFVLIQAPEVLDEDAEFDTVAEIAKERLRRFAEDRKGGSADLGFRALTVDTSNLDDVLATPNGAEQDQLDFQANNVKSDRTDEDLLFQTLLDWGIELSIGIFPEQFGSRRVFVIDNGALVACFDDEVCDSVLREIAGRQPLRAVFRDSGFASDADRINAEQIFAELSPGTDVKVI